MRKFKCTAIVMEWVSNDMMKKWSAEDYIVAEDEVEAKHMFFDNIEEQYDTSDVALDIDDINILDIGPADLVLSVRLTDYSKIGETMTVGELCQYLTENFDPETKIYLGEYSGITARYGYITEDCFECEEEKWQDGIRLRGIDMDKIELLQRLYDEKMELYEFFQKRGWSSADSYFWEARGIETALKILTDEEYYKKRLGAHE